MLKVLTFVLCKHQITTHLLHSAKMVLQHFFIKQIKLYNIFTQVWLIVNWAAAFAAANIAALSILNLVVP